MNARQVNIICDKIRASGQPELKLIETHISWLILLKEVVYKIKKPLKYSFLDFSTLGKRKYYCYRELELNQRLTEEMYLDVVTIRSRNDRLVIDSKDGKIIDYALKMKRMDETRQMNLLIHEDKVTNQHMDQLADTLATFHTFTDIIESPVDPEMMYLDFADILDAGCKKSMIKFISDELGKEVLERIEEGIKLSFSFLKKYASRLEFRRKTGYTIDGHGDLHTKNIFLLDRPVIFDCIEFNDHFRQLDILDELAFFCMDLDLYDRADLAQEFLEKYLIYNPCISHDADRQIFKYYKLYRSNVKIKVNVLKALQASDEEKFEDRRSRASNYFDLYQRYVHELYI